MRRCCDSSLLLCEGDGGREGKRGSSIEGFFISQAENGREGRRFSGRFLLILVSPLGEERWRLGRENKEFQRGFFVVFS